MRILIAICLLSFISCDSWIYSSYAVRQQAVNESKDKAKNPIALLLVNKSPSDLAKDGDYFISLLSQSLPQNVYFISKEMPSNISPKEIGKYEELKRRESDVLLYFILSFEEKKEENHDGSYWIYANVEIKMQDLLEEKDLWQRYFQTDKGIISWKGKEKGKRIALEELSQKASKELAMFLSSLTLEQNKRVRLNACFNTQEQLQLFLSELTRLEKANHFQILKNLLVVSTFMVVTLESEKDLLALKSLFEQSCQSVGISTSISLGRKSILLESKE
ncbi:MAG: hypothetical protein HUU50_22295 [Candidatus Brocadiae bacterium]|nr:hypothetical protein [Candidatus Brocadiia bacterium]